MVSVAQLDRALGCGPSGRGFESLHSPQAPVAQLDRASDFESAGRPFEPGRARQELPMKEIEGIPEPLPSEAIDFAHFPKTKVARKRLDIAKMSEFGR